MKKIYIDTFIAMSIGVPVLIINFATSGNLAVTPTLKNVLILLVVSPVLEEILFRGTIQQKLHDICKGAYLPILITSIIFALAHLILRQNVLSLLVFFPSLVLGLHYSRNRSLIAVILIHSFYNLMVLDYTMLLR